MPNRMLRDWTDSYAVNELEPNAERFFVRLIMKADDLGRFHADPKLLRSNCFPLKDDIRDTDISRWLAACEKAGLVRLYNGPLGRKYLMIPKFRQRLRLKKPSQFPAPPKELELDDGQMTDMCLTYDGHVTDICPPEEKRREIEENRREGGNGTCVPSAQRAPVISDAQWIGLLATDSAYSGIDVACEHAKMLRWCEVNRRKPTRKRFISWLNRVDRPLQGVALVTATAPVPRFAQIKALEATIARKVKELPGLSNRELYPEQYEADMKKQEPLVAEIKALKIKLADLKAQEAA